MKLSTTKKMINTFLDHIPVLLLRRFEKLTQTWFAGFRVFPGLRRCLHTDLYHYHFI